MRWRRFSERAERGATLVEMVIVIIILSIALVAVISAFSGAASRSADPLWQYKTLKLAQLYMDEILSKAYDDSTPPGGEPPSTSISCSGLGPEEANREDYDDVDDYIVTNVPPAIVGATGMALSPTYADFRITVNVRCAGSDLGLASNNNAKRITLEITPPPGIANAGTMMFSAYKGNY